jgi:aspartyl/asparaginyl-tRNA synthetase
MEVFTTQLERFLKRSFKRMEWFRKERTMDKMVEIRSDLAQAILDYLSNQPYREVAKLIAALLQQTAPKPKQEDSPKGE